ncbi:uncharacterized protein [Argopecten irradians]|uniref:uncharacterized protein n=1 Tax=Argopecten irradians TaxID=31199 RepID=UPI003717F80D
MYRKPTHTDQYLKLDSHQPLEHKLGVIRTLTHRANSIYSIHQAKTQEEDHLKKVLSVSGYSKWAWDLPRSRTKTTERAHQRQPAKGHITNHTSEVFRRPSSCKEGVTVHTKYHSRDAGSTMYKSGAIYKISCVDCSSTYVGETERPLRKLMAEHHGDSSPVGAHMRNHYIFTTDSIRVLDQDSRWFQRGAKEAIYVAASKPDLNQDR